MRIRIGMWSGGGISWWEVDSTKIVVKEDTHFIEVYDGETVIAMFSQWDYWLPAPEKSDAS